MCERVYLEGPYSKCRQIVLLKQSVVPFKSCAKYLSNNNSLLEHSWSRHLWPSLRKGSCLTPLTPPSPGIRGA